MPTAGGDNLMPRVIMNHSENNGVSYYRMWMISKYLKRKGWDVHDFSDNVPLVTIDEWEQICKGADLFVTQRSDNPMLVSLFMAIREQFNIPIVFEIDDDMYDVAKNSPAAQYFFPGSPFIELTEMVMKNSDAMTVSTQFLADKYSAHNKHIHVLPNAQDPEDWDNLPVIRGEKADQIVIGWAGSATHYDDLKMIWRPMKQILRRHKNVVFRVLGCLPDFMADHPQVELRSDWAPIREWQGKLASLQFDIGLCPVVHRDFNLGKSNIKWQEYAMLGVPTVASQIGEYLAINHGVDGLLANTDAEWELQVEKLVKNAELRQQIGSAAKQRVLTDFNISKNIKEWERTYARIITDFKSIRSSTR